MSLFSYRSSLLSLGPRVTTGQSWMLFESSSLTVALTLGATRRRVHIDATRRRVRSDTKRLWRTKCEEWRFDEVDYVDYRFSTLSHEFIAGSRAGRWTLQSSDTLERFSLELVHGDGRRLQLGSFWGAGAVETGPLGVVLGDDIFDGQGTQEDDSRQVLEALLGLTGFRLGAAPSPAEVIRKNGGELCPGCTQWNARGRISCLYCGARL